MKDKTGNRGLLDLKVKVVSKDEAAFQELAITVDKPDFLRLLPHLREDYGVKKLVSLEHYLNVTLSEFCEKSDYGKINLKKYKRYQTLNILLDSSNLDTSYLFEEDNYFPRLETESKLICFILNRPAHFADVFIQAMFCGAVNEEFYKSTVIEIMDKDYTPSDPLAFTIPEIAISITPATTYQDLKDCFQAAKEKIKTDKRFSYYKPRADSVPNIRMYRHWYWERLKGRKYREIADDWFNKHENDVGVDEIAVMKGVRKYKQLLKI